jgi:hypothetical protein
LTKPGTTSISVASRTSSTSLRARLPVCDLHDRVAVNEQVAGLDEGRFVVAGQDQAVRMSSRLTSLLQDG